MDIDKKTQEINMEQYKNLRSCFHKNLVEPILGEDYYNMACDVYNCDRITTEHLKREFDVKDKVIKTLNILFKISLLVNILFVANAIFK